MRRLAGAALCAAMLLGGCNDSGSPARGAIAEGLQQLVTDVRDAAERRDADGARLRLAELKATVADLVRQGSLDSQQAEALLAAAASVEAQLVTIEPTTTLAPTTTAPPPPPPSGDAPKRGKGNKDNDD